MTGATSSAPRACSPTLPPATRPGRTSPGSQALDLDIPLLSDWNADATKGFGVAFDYRGMRDVSERSVFLIDREGVVRGAWRYGTAELPDFDVLLTAAQAL